MFIETKEKIASHIVFKSSEQEWDFPGHSFPTNNSIIQFVRDDRSIYLR